MGFRIILLILIADVIFGALRYLRLRPNEQLHQSLTRHIMRLPLRVLAAPVCAVHVIVIALISIAIMLTPMLMVPLTLLICAGMTALPFLVLAIVFLLYLHMTVIINWISLFVRTGALVYPISRLIPGAKPDDVELWQYSGLCFLLVALIAGIFRASARSRRCVSQHIWRISATTSSCLHVVYSLWWRATVWAWRQWYLYLTPA